MKAVVLVCSIIVLILTSFNCKSPTAPSGSGISISVADVSCTEVWLNLSANNVTLPANIIIKKNGNNFLNLNLTTKDTTLYDSTLLPSQTYTYQAQYNKGFAFERSGVATAKTLDTTSSNFIWQTYTFGSPAAGSSYLNDVSIINDTDIIAVGAVYLTDSTGHADLFPYNLVQWDGVKWNLKKISVEYKGNKTIAPLTGINVLSDRSIVLSSGLPYIPDANGGWKLYQLWDMGILNENDGSVNHIWGLSIDNLFFVGNKGTIVFYSSDTWQKIESGTTLPIQNIWGNANSLTGKSQILCVASDKYYNQGNELIEIKNNNTAIAIPDSGLPWSLSSVWFIPNRKYYIAGDGVFQTTSLDKRWTEVKGLPRIYSDAIRGINYNEIVVSGSNGTLSYFNGVRWHNYINNPLPYISGRLVSVSIKGNTIAAVGFNGEQAYIVIGRR